MIESFIIFVGAWLHRCRRRSLAAFLAYPLAACLQDDLRRAGVTVRMKSGVSWLACLERRLFGVRTSVGIWMPWKNWNVPGLTWERGTPCCLLQNVPKLATCWKVLGYMHFSSGEMSTDSEWCPFRPKSRPFQGPKFGPCPLLLPQISL